MRQSDLRGCMSSETDIMDRPTQPVLGKRGRRSMVLEQAEVEAEEQSVVSKRLRTRETSDDVADQFPPTAGPSTARPQSDLLTPEPSSLTESTASQPTSTPSVAINDALEKSFPFMKLPAELRCHIYYMALVREEPLLLHADRAPEKLDEDVAAWYPITPGFLHSPFGSRTNPAERRARRQSFVPERTPLEDPIVPAILRVNRLIYKEARQVLYSDNIFTLSLSSGIHTLSTLHQRSRSLIKHVVLTIPSHHDILDGFADLVRLGLRYCWGLRTFRIILQAGLPDDGRVSGATSVYANAFHILRWLPRGCKVMLDGNVSEAVKSVVNEEGRLQSVLDETSYLKRQHQMPERH